MISPTQIIAKILDYYEFLLREDEVMVFKHTGTPSYHILIKSKMDDSTEYKELPHGIGVCVLNLGSDKQTFVFDELYDMLIPVIGDDAIISKWKKQRQAEADMQKQAKSYLEKRGILVLESIIDMHKEDIVRIVSEHGLDAYKDEIEGYGTETELVGEKLADIYLYLIHEGNAPGRLSYFILSKQDKLKEDVLVDVFDYYAFLDSLIAANTEGSVPREHQGSTGTE